MFTYKTLAKYMYGGTILVEEHPGGKVTYTLVISGDIDNLRYKKEILFNIAPAKTHQDLGDESLDRE
jgi:hypothetical protein